MSSRSLISLVTPEARGLDWLAEMTGTDFSLRQGGAAVDAGCRLPNVNDDFTGRGPDLGALELDRPVPVYGPRR
jgi:hypothetical protein